MAVFSVMDAWKIFTYYFTIPLYLVGFKGQRISFGFWIRFTKDPLEPPEQVGHLSSRATEKSADLFNPSHPKADCTSTGH